MASITAADGVALAVDDRTLPAPRARVIIVHGYAEHLGRYDEFVSRLEARNFECHRFDLRGHGHSGGIAAHVARFKDYIDDLELIVERVRRAATDDRPLFIVGHSLGGLISLVFVRSHRPGVAALAVASPFLRPGFEIPSVKKALATIASRLAPTLSLASNLDPALLSTDTEKVVNYANDPLVHRTTTPRWFTEVEEAQRELEKHAGEVTLPLLMLLGGEDQIADHRLAAQVFERIGSADKTIRTYEDLRHELFNETRREVVIDELAGWLERHS